MLPTEPGVYHDARGDEWVLHEDGRWQWTGRRMGDGSLWPVNDHPGASTEALASATPSEAILPLTRASLPD